MKRFLVLLSATSMLGAAACSQPEVVIEARLPQQGEQGATPLAELPIAILPYDRDAIFDSLEAAADEPEPAIPPDILEAQQQVQAAQSAWRETEDRWSTVRDSLRALGERTTQMQNQGLRGTPQYRQLFEEFNRLEGEERSLNAEVQSSFARFEQLQRETLARADSIRVAREAWAERAFADYPQIIEARLLELGIEELADTTNANGVAVIEVPEGNWWVHARYTLPFEELYWNVPIEVQGDSVSVQLTPETADRRPLM